MKQEASGGAEKVICLRKNILIFYLLYTKTCMFALGTPWAQLNPVSSFQQNVIYRIS